MGKHVAPGGRTDELVLVSDWMGLGRSTRPATVMAEGFPRGSRMALVIFLRMRCYVGDEGGESGETKNTRETQFAPRGDLIHQNILDLAVHLSSLPLTPSL